MFAVFDDIVLNHIVKQEFIDISVDELSLSSNLAVVTACSQRVVLAIGHYHIDWIYYNYKGNGCASNSIW